MQDLIKELKKDHIQIRKVLTKILGVIDAEKLNINELKVCCSHLEVLWNFHEAKEEHIFNYVKKENLPEKKSVIDKHRELRGHWKVLNMALNTGDDSKIKVAIDTDGRMLFKRLIKHMRDEEDYFTKLK